MNKALIILMTICGALNSAPLSAGEVDGLEINSARAKFHYQMMCEGCHTANGDANNSVPRLQGFVGHFLNTQEGREFIVRVPGVANAALSDELLAELINWMFVEFAADSLPDTWTRYSSAELNTLRKQPLFETERRRAKVLQGVFSQLNNSIN